MSGPEDGDDGSELAGDLVGTVSARLLAAGVPREDRLGALRLLGALDTLADRDDRVRRPLAQVGAEFELPADDLEQWLDALVEVGAVDVDGGGIRLAARESPSGSMRLHDFLAVVAQLDNPPTARRLPAVLRPASAVLVAAALLVAVMLTPGLVRNPAPDDSANLAAPTAGSSVSTSGVERPNATTESSGVDGALIPSGVAAASPACPSGAPTFVVDDVVSGPNLLTVTGTVRNAADQPAAVTAFTLVADIGGQDVPIPATAVPLVIPANGSTAWEAAAPLAAPTGTTVRVVLDHWEWRGAAAGCPAV
jgi:hypothetical protein